MSAKLTPAEIAFELGEVTDWKVDANGELTKTFKQTHFLNGLAFVTKVAVVAEKAGHHPDILLTYPSVKISLTTHDAEGLTAKDFSLAKAIDSLI
jgi:4a-hydroxytetrahydrobiopterin dehydratase